MPSSKALLRLCGMLLLPALAHAGYIFQDFVGHGDVGSINNLDSNLALVKQTNQGADYFSAGVLIPNGLFPADDPLSGLSPILTQSIFPETASGGIPTSAAASIDNLAAASEFYSSGLNGRFDSSPDVRRAVLSFLYPGSTFTRSFGVSDAGLAMSDDDDKGAFYVDANDDTIGLPESHAPQPGLLALAGLGTLLLVFSLDKFRR